MVVAGKTIGSPDNRSSTYKRPVKKITLIPIFFLVVICRAQMVGIGIMRIKKSLKILMLARITPIKSPVSIHFGVASAVSHDCPGNGTQTIEYPMMQVRH